jgi:hypothetical protein
VSSKGRGPSLGGENELYPTPSFAVEQFWRSRWAFDIPREGVWLDPCTGDGSLVRYSAAFFDEQTEWDVCELDSRKKAAPDFGDAYIRKEYFGKTFLGRPHDGPFVYDGVFMNPPFSRWWAFTDRALRLAPNVIVLGNLTVLGAAERLRWWPSVAHRLTGLHIILPRPRFRKNCSDSVDTAWFVFSLGTQTPFVTWPTLNDVPPNTRKRALNGPEPYDGA